MSYECEVVSPLGDSAARARARADHPTLAPIIDDLEQVITPPFHAADRLAIVTQRAVKRTRLVEMAGAAAVAVLAITQIALRGDEWPGWIQALGIAAAVIAAITALAAGRGRSQNLEDWLDQRRIAEDLRSLYFLALTSTELADHPNRKRLVRAQVQQVLKPKRNLPDFEPDVDIDPKMDRLGNAAWQLYREARLDDQLAWLRRKSETVKARTDLLGGVQTGLIVTASICAAITVARPGWWWFAIPVAASGGLVSFLAAVDSVVASERLAQHYGRTVARLELIERSLDDTGSRGDVEEVELVLTAEHREWRRIAEGNQQ